MKKIAALALAVLMVLSMAACGGTTTPSTEGTKEEAKSLKICIITSSGIDDGNFNQNCYEGIQSFLKNHSSCTVKDIKESDTSKLIETVESVVADYDVFVLPGFNFAAVGDIVTANPSKYFIVVDSTITDAAGNAVTAPNAYTMTFSEQQSAFPCGVAAALTSKTGKVAVVNGIAFPSNVNYQYGFMAGVKYANAKFGTKVECIELPSYAGTDVLGNVVGGNYIGDFADEATGKVVAESLIAEGVDVILAAAGASGNGVFAAAKEAKDVFCIGCDVDQFDDGKNGDSNIVLTSTLKIMDKHVEKQLNAIFDGTFKGEDAMLDVTNEGVGYVSAEGRQQMSAETLTKVAEAFQAVKDGKVTVPADATANEYTPENFPME